MVFSNIEETVYLKDSEALSRKIEEIETALHNMNCATKISSEIYVENNEMSFDLRISFSLTHLRSVENLNDEPGENLPPAKYDKK
jgi:TATA-box binding protein (TBP) (component of TFIID and TFIIIB)